MHSSSTPARSPHGRTHGTSGACTWRRRAARWLVPNPILLAAAAILWLILRSGTKPARLAYPCQRAALGSASLALGLPLAHFLTRIALSFRVKWTHLVVFAGAAAAAGLVSQIDLRATPSASNRAASLTPADYRAAVYAVENVGGPAGHRHLGVDALITCMGAGGLKFYKSETTGPESGPDGIVGAEDLVLIKINQQWPSRCGTNTDVLRGLIARIIEHPDGFYGEVVVVENTQTWGTLDWDESNAEDPSQSTQDVVDDFALLGWPVSARLWDDIRSTSVAEYSSGDMQEGYVVGAWNTGTQIRVSYPKFQTAMGRYVSLKHGIWDPESESYDDTKLTFLNLPVLKCHGYQYGVTGALKHHVGTMTTALSTNTHAAVEYGGLGSFLAEVRMPDLNIIDCIYILARPNAGPWCEAVEATRVDKLLAGLDPVALDLWATVNVLVPTIVANGYTEYPMQDPDDPGSIFRIYLDNTMITLLTAGIEVTSDLDRIDAHVCEAADVAGETGAPDAEPATRAHPNPSAGDAIIRFALPRAGFVTLDIHDAAGRRLWTTRRHLDAGPNREILWGGSDDHGRRAPAGVYYYSVRFDGQVRAGTVALVR